jgi:RNA polymerase sigma factor (sigma-70 family)
MKPHPPEHSKLEKVSSTALRIVWTNSQEFPPLREQDPHIERVRDILHKNLSNGRWQRATRGKDNLTDEDLRQYAQRVAKRYWIERETIIGLSSSNPSLWRDLHDKLKQHALNTCTRYGVPLGRAKNLASDHAQEACEIILCNHYPCDVPFDAWAGRILINCVLQKLQRSTDLMDRETFVEPSIEDLWDARRSDQVLLNTAQPATEDLETYTLLLDAIERLPSEAQRQVILLEFFFDWEAEQIAEKLGRTPQAVYNLKYRALQKLREILDRKWGFRSETAGHEERSSARVS